jgi:hypothetical protein
LEGYCRSPRAEALPSECETIASIKNELLRRLHILRGRDLIIALGWHRRLLEVDNEFAEYWHLRFELLTRAFDLPPNWDQDRTRTPRMISTLAPHACNSDGFFSGVREYTPLPGEMTIKEYHQLRITAAEANLREHFLEYGEALLLRYWPQVQLKL